MPTDHEPPHPAATRALTLMACTPRSLDELDTALQEFADTGDPSRVGAFVADGWRVLGMGLARIVQDEIEIDGGDLDGDGTVDGTIEGPLAREMMRRFPGIFALLSGRVEVDPSGDLRLGQGRYTLAGILPDLLRGLAIATLDLGGHWDLLSYALDGERRAVQEFEPFGLGYRSLAIRGEGPLVLGAHLVLEVRLVLEALVVPLHQYNL